MDKKINKIKIGILIISLLGILSSCVVYNEWHSEEGYIYDVSDFLYAFDTERKDSVRDLEVNFSLSNCSHGIRSKEAKTFPRSLRYNFHISSPYYVSSLLIPNVKLNYFSFTDEEGDTIHTIHYVQLLNYKNEILIDTLLESLTDEMRNGIKYDCINIEVKSNQSCYDTKLFYANYDIEVGSKRYVKSIKYKRKWFFDLNLH